MCGRESDLKRTVFSGLCMSLSFLAPIRENASTLLLSGMRFISIMK
jgi:hypothetical protein